MQSRDQQLLWFSIKKFDDASASSVTNDPTLNIIKMTSIKQQGGLGKSSNKGDLLQSTQTFLQSIKSKAKVMQPCTAFFKDLNATPGGVTWHIWDRGA